MSANQRTDCFFNLTTPERIDLFRRRQALRVEHVFRTFYGWAMLPLAICGAIATIVFIICCYKAIKTRRVSRKCYALLMNRAIGDALTCCSALVTCTYVLTWHDINRDMVVVIESFFIGSFWSAMVSYCSLSVLKLFAVWKPFHYRKWFTMRRCVNLMIISWTILVLMVSYTLAVSALVKIPDLNAWSGCKAETCLRNMYRSRNLMTASVYCFTIIVFVVTCFFIRKAQNFSNSFKKREKDGGGRIRMVRFPLWKLALNVGTFAILMVPYAIWCIGLVLNPYPCLFQRNYAEMMRLLGCIRLFLVIRCILDPLLAFFTDFQRRPMNIYHEDANPQGIYISYAQRFLQVGKLINASFPVPYLPLINDEESGALKGLLKWVLTTEREIFTASHNPEEYKKLVEMTMAGAEQVRDEMKATGMGYGIVRPGDPSYWLGQLLSHLMKLSRHSADVAFADKILYVTCGMMNLPGPLYVPRAVIDQSPRGKTAEMREYTCFQLLRRIFPCPWADGRLYITAELILFGNNLEQAIWLSARNTQEYLDCLDNTKTHIQGILRAENDELTGRMPEFPITEPFLMHTSDHGEPQEEFA